MRIIEEIARQYPSLDLESIRILLTIHDNPGFSIREVADILVLNKKNVQIKVALMAEGRKNRSGASKRRLVNIDRKLTDKRARDLMLTDAGMRLAERLSSLKNNL